MTQQKVRISMDQRSEIWLKLTRFASINIIFLFLRKSRNVQRALLK